MQSRSICQEVLQVYRMRKPNCHLALRLLFFCFEETNGKVTEWVERRRARSSAYSFALEFPSCFVGVSSYADKY